MQIGELVMETRLESFFRESLVVKDAGDGKRLSLDSCCELFNHEGLFHGGDVILAYEPKEGVFRCAAGSIPCKRGIFFNIKLLELILNVAYVAGVYAVGKLGADVLYIYALKNRLKKDLDIGLKRLENRLQDVLGIAGFRLVVSDSGNEEEAIEMLFRQNSYLKPMNEWIMEKALRLLTLLI